MKLSATRLRALRTLADAHPSFCCICGRPSERMYEVGTAATDWLIAHKLASGEPYGPTPTRARITETGLQLLDAEYTP